MKIDPENKCPECFNQLEDSTDPNGNETAVPGSLSVCAYCAILLQFNQEMKSERLPAERFNTLNEKTRHHLLKIQTLILQNPLPRTKITLATFENIEADAVFAKGLTTNDPTGINMTGDGTALKWLAKKGYGNDWAIYIHRAHLPDRYIETSGDKVASEQNIRKLVPCDDEVFNKYRL